ncbi:MAG: hypothetical protein N3I86_00820 [Verrucomicrobiae bacterium]|nr:hypothetical protein [Verrucomicrobiae bacterium]
MKTKFIVRTVAAFALLSTLNPQPSTCRAQGSLSPPGPPAPTMKTLAQVEPRTAISSAPFAITNPGSYYLTTNLVVSTGDAITIATNGVTLDLNGFTISSTAASATGFAVRIMGGLCNLRIMNGFISGGVTNSGGIYSGPGFQYGIAGPSLWTSNITVSGVHVSGCLADGILLGANSYVESCIVQTVGGYGILATTVKDSIAAACGQAGISGTQVLNCSGESILYSYGIYANTAINSAGYSKNFVGLSAETALNCYGSSPSQGLFARTAQNCSGYGGSGQGLAAQMAVNCYGYSQSSSGVHATVAQNCIGYSSSGAGVYAEAVAIACFGCSGTGPGIHAFIANSCRVWCGTTTITHKYNMP